MSAFSDFGFGRTDIPHYYGDLVRQLFIAVAVVWVAGDAVYGGYLLPLSLPAQLMALLLLIVLAALTGPHGRVVMLLNAIAAALGVFVIELFALPAQSTEPTIMLLLQELMAFFLIFALYYSIKTLRAYATGKLGHLNPPEEFGR